MKAKRLLVALGIGLGLTVALVGLLGSSATHAAPAATYTVTNTDPSGPGSLHQAILDANANAGHDTIDFGISGTIVLTGELPLIDDDLTISGPGADQLAVSGAGVYRVFHIKFGAAVTLTGVTVRDGSASDGGGIWTAGDLQLDSVHILDNSASNNGGGVYVSFGGTTLSGAQVLSNSASSEGGGVYVRLGSATLSGTRVVSNSAQAGGGLFIRMYSATLNGTQVVSNSAVASGGGVYVYAGSLSVDGGELRSNSAGSGAGMYILQGSATLSGTQVVSNSSLLGKGGGVCLNDDSASLSVNGR